MLLCDLKNFSEKEWQRAFQAYVKANRSHWLGPPHSVVQKILEDKGQYEFSVTAMGRWASKFRLYVQNGKVFTEFVKNPELPQNMQDHLATMEKIFLHELNS